MAELVLLDLIVNGATVVVVPIPTLPSTCKYPFACILPELSNVEPEEPYPPPTFKYVPVILVIPLTSNLPDIFTFSEEFVVTISSIPALPEESNDKALALLSVKSISIAALVKSISPSFLKPPWI